MIFLIGGTGLIGSAFKRYFKSKKIIFKNITRNNKKKFYGKKCNLLIDCNGNGSKGAGIRDPFFDFNASVLTVVENLTKIKYKKYIYISTAQVYESLSKKKFTKEDILINHKKVNGYGFNKYISELYVKKYAENYLIIRLPYIVGPGLKRNPFYDLPNQNKTFITLDSDINCIHTNSIAKLTMELNKKSKNNTFNLGSTDNIKIREFVKMLKIEEKKILKTKRIKDINKIDFNKAKNLVQLPKIKTEILKYLKGK
jgi:nucleoside-diphosphate-sugar epimerase